MAITGDRYEFTDENMGRSPEMAGVYALYDGDETIYIGRAQGDTTTIRSRLQAHKRGDEGTCTIDATHYRREPTESAVRRETELLEEYKRNNGGRLPRCNKRVG